MKNLPAKNRELGNLIKAAIRMMLLDGHTELGFGNCKVGCILPTVI